MAHDRRAVGDALNRLGHRERGAVRKQAIEAAAAALPADRAQHVRCAADRLSDRVRGLGPCSALEVLAAIGMLWAEDGHER